MSNKVKFYNKYHGKNSNYFRIITENNFTYFNILPFLSLALDGFNKENRKVLDVGCGVGTLAFYLANKNCVVEGYDVSSRAIKICNQYKKVSKIKNISFHRGDVERIEGKKKYNLVICTEVIEHITDDLKFIRSLNQLLLKSGYLVLSTPSLNAPLFRLGLLEHFDKEVGHLRRYSSTKLVKLLNRGGFKVIKLEKKESILRNSLYTFKPLGFVLKFIKGPLIPFFHEIDSIFTILFGESDLIILAQKK